MNAAYMSYPGNVDELANATALAINLFGSQRPASVDTYTAVPRRGQPRRRGRSRWSNIATDTPGR